MSLITVVNNYITQATTSPITAELVAAASTDTNSDDYVTGSISFGDSTNALYLMAIITADPSNDSVGNNPGVAGGNMTWTRVAFVGRDGGGGFLDTGLSVFRASGSAVDGTLTLSNLGLGGSSVDGYRRQLVKLTNVDTTTNNGVVQSASNSTTSDSLSVTLSAFADATNNVACAFFGSIDDSNGTITFTEGSGFTILSQAQVTLESAYSVATCFEYKTGQDTGVDATILAANDWMAGIAMEINALA